MWARRVRAEVQRQCDRALAEPPRSENDRYWIFATHWEAAVGLGDASAAAWRQKAEIEAERLASPSMFATTTRQINALVQLLVAYR